MLGSPEGRCLMPLNVTLLIASCAFLAVAACMRRRESLRRFLIASGAVLWLAGCLVMSYRLVTGDLGGA